MSRLPKFDFKSSEFRQIKPKLDIEFREGTSVICGKQYCEPIVSKLKIVLYGRA
jgi:hypothetical protein